MKSGGEMDTLLSKAGERPVGEGPPAERKQII